MWNSLLLNLLFIYKLITEREENVKSDIFHAYVALLRQTRPSVGVSLDPDLMDQEDGPVCMLQAQVSFNIITIQCNTLYLICLKVYIITVFSIFWNF